MRRRGDWQKNQRQRPEPDSVTHLVAGKLGIGARDELLGSGSGHDSWLVGWRREEGGKGREGEARWLMEGKQERQERQERQGWRACRVLAGSSVECVISSNPILSLFFFFFARGLCGVCVT